MISTTPAAKATVLVVTLLILTTAQLPTTTHAKQSISSIFTKVLKPIITHNWYYCGGLRWRKRGHPVLVPWKAFFRF